LVDDTTKIDLNKCVADDEGSKIYMDLTWTIEGAGVPESIPSHIFGVDSGIFWVKPPSNSAGEVYIIEVWLKDEQAK
jgi:hypothetical protein